MSRTAVVTGAAGFLGQHVVQDLLGTGQHVVAVDRRPCPQQLMGRPGVEYLEADLCAADDAVADALRGADAVIHLAACPGVRDARPGIELRRHRDNVVASRVVLDATPVTTPLVVTSSSSVYGGSEAGRPCREEHRLRPRGGYAASKVLVEELCARRRDSGGSVTVARPFTVAGEGQRPDMAVSLWLEAARAGRPLRLFGSPACTRDVTDVRDAARVLVALAGRDAGGTVNVGTGQAHTLRELADAVCAAVGRQVPRVVLPATEEEVRHTLADTSRLRSLLGSVPVTDLPALVARQAAATAQKAGSPAGRGDAYVLARR